VDSVALTNKNRVSLELLGLYSPYCASAPVLAICRLLSYNWHQEACTRMPHTADDSDLDRPSLDELISLREAAELSGLSASHLRLLVSRGDIWGQKIGRNWVTTAEAVQRYVAQDHRPGPKPKKPQN